MPFLVHDLRLTLQKTYTTQQLAELDHVLKGCGIDMEASKHLEIIPEADINERIKELALEMAGLDVLPWCLRIDEEAVIRSCFYGVVIFGDVFYMHSSFYRPAEVNIFITANGVETGGAMENN